VVVEEEAEEADKAIMAEVKVHKSMTRTSGRRGPVTTATRRATIHPTIAQVPRRRRQTTVMPCLP